MKIEYDGTGDVILDPEELAHQFSLSSDSLRRYLSLGLVTSTIERGEGDDLGKTRLSVRVGNRIWRAVEERGSILRSERRILGAIAPLKPAP